MYYRRKAMNKSVELQGYLKIKEDPSNSPFEEPALTEASVACSASAGRDRGM